MIHDVTCADTPSLSVGEYNDGLHIAAIFIIMTFSLLGALLPLISTKIEFLQHNTWLTSLLNAIGVGVVISTALIHMIPPAIESLNSPCLNLPYRGLALVFVLISMLLIQIFETELVILMSSESTESSQDCSNTVVVEMSNGQHHQNHHNNHDATFFKKDNLNRKVNVLIFECGVAVHSVIIGLELGVSSGSEFTTLLIAISFHQFFEGVAVGSTCYEAFAHDKISVIAAAGFALSAPFGIGIGMLVYDSYSPTSTTALWVQGTLDAVAAGILIYTGLVELLTYQFTMNPKFHAKGRLFRWANYVCILIGASVMATIGLWT